MLELCGSYQGSYDQNSGMKLEVGHRPTVVQDRVLSWASWYCVLID